MNERIQELFQEAIDYADKTHAYTPEEGFNIQVWDKIRFEKFAELIIKECLGQVADVRIEHDFDPTVDEVLVQALMGIKKYFGVEE